MDNWNSLNSLLMVALCTIHTVYGFPTSGCTNKPADVVFVLDSSNSIWLNDFTKQTAFVREVVKQFDVGPGEFQTRVGIITFGHDVWPQFNLNDVMDIKSMISAIDKIKHGQGRMTNTGDAINYAVKQMFTSISGSRPGVTRVVIVITDGRSQKTLETRLAAEKAHEFGLITFAIGVGRNLDLQELTDIASKPTDSFLFMVDDFNALSSITDRLAKKTCAVTKTPLIPTPTEPTKVTTTLEAPSDQSHISCGGKPADVFFVIDSSGSINSKDFNKELDFVRNVVKMFDVSANKTRVGIVVFSHDAQMFLPLNNTLNKQELLDSISKVSHIGGGTNTAAALRLVRQDGFLNDIARAKVPKIAIVLTDGLSANEDLTQREAKLTQLSGISVFAIGIGNGVDLIEIRNIASNPDDNYVFQVDDFNSLDTIKEVLAIKTCDENPTETNDGSNDEKACEVGKETDILFIYDASAMGANASHVVSQFIAAVVTNLDIASGNLRVGRITDNCPSGGNFDLSNKLTAADFKEITVSSYSNLIKKTRTLGFNPENGGRSGATNVSVLFVNSDRDEGETKTVQEAKELIKASEVFVVAIGQSPTIKNISEAMKARNILRVDALDDLNDLAGDFVNKLCYFFSLDFNDYNIDYVIPV